ncbi:MAG: DUF1345 domain-containing protein [Hyphomonadaceae bacterium]|nr:DUF1345 domain-containing protein [Hyphomonadaceae bacterium]
MADGKQTGGGIVRSHMKLIWAAALGAGTAAALFTIPNPLAATTRWLMAWDVLAASFVCITLLVARGLTPDDMERRAAEQDDGRGLILAVSLLSAAASLLAIWQELGAAKQLTGPMQEALVALAFLTVALSWLFTHTIFASHYAHEYFAPDDDETERAGLIFPAHSKDAKPDFWDFLHFALVIGVANQTADVQIRSRGIRRVVTIHGIVAFLFNTVILAISINFAASLFGD